MTRKQAERQEAETSLKKLLSPGDRVHCVIRSVSRSGMSRRIDFFAIKGDELRFLSGYIAKLLPEIVSRSRDREGLRVNGCGMDMGFHVVYAVSQTLFASGYALHHVWI